jgi:hypothetical protein
VNEEKYSWRVLESDVPPNRRKIETSMKGKKIPNLLVFKPTFKPEPPHEEEIDDPN